MDLDLLRPGFLLLVLLLPLLFFFPRRAEGAGGDRLRDWRHPLLRAAAAAALVLALSWPVASREDGATHRVVLIDRGAAVDDAAATRSLAAAKRLAAEGNSDDVRWHLVDLATAERRRGAAPEGFTTVRTLDADRGAPLGAGLTAALALIPEGSGGTVTYLGRGAALDRDWAAAALEAGARGVAIDTWSEDEPLVAPRAVALEAMDELRVGHETVLRLAVEGPAARLRVVLEEDAEAVVESDWIDVPAPRAEIDLRFAPRRAGFVRYIARIEAAGGANAEPLAREFAVQDPVSVLYLGARMKGGDAGLQARLGPGFRVETAGAEGELDASRIGEYDVVALDDRPASTMTPELRSAVAEAVEREGCGLFASGGSGAFGPGGWHDTPIGEILPVEMVQKEEKKDPSTALAIIIDTSGSMGGNRIILAKEVTRLAIRRLLPHDKVGIVEFYGNKRWAAPLQSAANAIEIQRALNRLDAGGGTVLFPALEEAFYGLRNVQTRYKHVLILTDAGVETGPYESILRRMAKEGICVSTVLTGPGRHSDFLVQLADWGGGRYYNASDRFNLPEIMLKQPSTARLPAYRPGVVEVEGGGSRRWWGEIDRETVPALAGYVETRARPGAEVVLRTRRDGHPILASWRHGLGRVTAFTSEPAGPGTESWRDWDGYSELLGRALRATASLTREPFAWTLRREGRDFRLEARRLNVSATRPSARRLAASGEGEDLVFEERAPGTFVAVGFAPRDESLRIEAGVDGSTSRARRLVAPAEGDYPGRLARPDGGALELARVASATGGRLLGELRSSELSAPRAERPRELLDLRPWALLIALLLFLADVLLRRLPVRRPAAPAAP